MSPDLKDGMGALAAARRDERRELAKQLHEAVMEYGQLLRGDTPAADEALAIHLALQGLKKVVASWEPKRDQA